MENVGLLMQLGDIFLSSLRKQSFSLILTVMGLAGLGWWNLDYKREMNAKVAGLENSVSQCNEKRMELSAEAAALRQQVDYLTLQVEAPARRKR